MRLTKSQVEDKRRDEAREGAEDRRKTPGALVRVRGCLCRSVWCQRCSKISPTNDVIRRRMGALDWRKVRHCILTVRREGSPESAFGAVRKNRAIAKAMEALGTGKWIWILEFHRGGWPHWHVLCENGGKMVGHERLSAAWKRGHVWESPIRSEDHWKAISGYYKSKGYLAGETKGHQLDLPEYLRCESRVRKFGANFTVSCPWPPTDAGRRSGGKKTASSFRHRFDYCDTETEVVVGDRSCTVVGALKVVRKRVSEQSIGRAGGGRYLVSQDCLEAILAAREVTP